MTDRELHAKKLQSQLDEWKAEVELLKARAASAGLGAQIEMRKQADSLDRRVHEAGERLSELTAASEDAWGNVKMGVDSAWDSLKAAVGEARSKFNA